MSINGPLVFDSMRRLLVDPLQRPDLQALDKSVVENEFAQPPVLRRLGLDLALQLGAGDHLVGGRTARYR